MTDKEVMQMALTAFEVATTHFSKDRQEILAAQEALRARLSAPEPEPVAWTVSGLITDFSRDFSAYQTKTYTRPLYTAPPQREWVGLTDEEINILFKNSLKSIPTGVIWNISRTIEAKLKEKNT